MECFDVECAPLESLRTESKILTSEQLGARKGGVGILLDFQNSQMEIVVDLREKRKEPTWLDGSQ